MIWWKDYALGPQEWARWRIGPLELFALATTGQWVFAWLTTEDPLDTSEATDIPAENEPHEATFTFGRYVARFERPVLKLLPRLADRAFVFRPELPLFLPAGQDIVLYVSSPVWVAGQLGEDEDARLFEIPSFRASDTWFGRDTCEGELCYASRTRALTDLETINVCPHRAVTPLEIRNEGDDVLPIEQLRVPLPALSLYEGGGRLWTDTVSLIRREDESSAAMSVSEAHAREAAGRVLLAKPRHPVESGTIISAFSRLLD